MTPTASFTASPTAASTATPTPVATATVTPTPTTGGALAALAVSKAAVPSPVAPGAPLAFTITVRNVGVVDALLVTITDPLPAGVLFQSCVASQGSCAGPTSGTNGTVTAALGTIPVAGTATLTIQTQAPGGVPTVLTNVATISGSNLPGGSLTATATVGVGNAASDVPALDGPMLAALGFLLALAGLRALAGRPALS